MHGGTVLTCEEAVTKLLKSPRRWEVRSAGTGSKGSRWYAWAWIGTASGTHSVLVRRHLKTGELALRRPRDLRRHRRSPPRPDRHAGTAADPPGPAAARRPRPHPAHRPASQAAAHRRDRTVMATGTRGPMGHLDPPPPGPLPLVPQTRKTRPQHRDLPGQLTKYGCRTGHADRRIGAQEPSCSVCSLTQCAQPRASRARASPPFGTAVGSSSGRAATVQIRAFGSTGGCEYSWAQPPHNGTSSRMSGEGCACRLNGIPGQPRGHLRCPGRSLVLEVGNSRGFPATEPLPTDPHPGDAVTQGRDHLRSGQFGTTDMTASTVANIEPGIDFYFAFDCCCNRQCRRAADDPHRWWPLCSFAFRVAEFTKAEPSAGSGAPTGVTCGSSLSRLTSARGAAGVGSSGLEERLVYLDGQRATNAHGVANGASSQNRPASVGCLLEEKGWVVGRRTFRIVEVLLGVAA